MTLAAVPRYEPDRVTRTAGRAIVTGGSISGLVTARVLADRFDEVILCERDRLPDRPVARRSVPQARAPHVLWEAGRQTLDDLFSGFTEAVLNEGGSLIDAQRDLNVFFDGDFLAGGASDQQSLTASRALFEQVLRRLLGAYPNVTIHDNCHVRAYRWAGTPPNVTGVEVQWIDENTTEELQSDLVVDCTGRTSRTPRQLEAHGYRSPKTERVTIDLAYGIVELERPATDQRAFVQTPHPPLGRGCVILPIENERSLVAMAGVHGDHPPLETDAFLHFAESLPFPEPHELLRQRTWLEEDVYRHPFPANRRQRYEKLERFPDGLLVVGDAIASVNPVYGQGMSVAVLQAAVLHRLLGDHDDASLARDFFRESTGVVDPAWRLSITADFKFPETAGTKPWGTALLNRYLDRVVRKAQTDGSIHRAFNRVVMMRDPPKRLFRPRVMWRVLKPFE